MNNKQLQCSQEQADLVSSVVDPVLNGIKSFIVGQEQPVYKTVLSLLAVGQIDNKPVNNEPFLGCGHVLFVGPVGTAKTVLCRRLAALVGGKHKRLQGTPDSLPTDMTGFEMISLLPGEESLKFREGPIFANVLLIDEINRYTPKTIAGLLQAMAEGTVTYFDKTYALPEPFLCLGTMNPSEQSGTSEINEALADRFMFCELMDDSSNEERVEIVRRLEDTEKLVPKQVTDLDAVNRLRYFIYHNIHIGNEVLNYCARIIEAVNDFGQSQLFAMEKQLLGGGRLFRQIPPLNNRTMIFLSNAAKIQATVNYRNYVNISDVRFILPAILRSRLSLVTEGALLNLVDEDGDAPYSDKQSLVTGLIQQILEEVPVV